MSAASQAEIGGYFGLELPPPREPVMPGALRLQSARACLEALLREIAPPRVWVPRYICDAMLQPLRRLGVAHSFYGIDRSLRLAPGPEIGPRDLLLCVNYFGLAGDAEQDAIARFGAERVVLDRAQAFHAPGCDCRAAIYSPRKFFGLPDGGLLATPAPIAPPAQRDAGSVGRSTHLLMRHDGPAQAGYAHFRRAEETLDDAAPRTMSALTARILDSIDVEAARRRRVANFAYLHERLGRGNELAIGAEAAQGPLCYPLLVRREGLRERLIENKVFVPAYWPDVLGRCAPGDPEHDLARFCVALPCDQRYGARELERVAALAAAAMKPSAIGSTK